MFFFAKISAEIFMAQEKFVVGPFIRQAMNRRACLRETPLRCSPAA
jgi:hypothetical protein